MEGPTDDEAVNAIRRRQERNFLATLFLSQGIPMLLGGDELGRTQGGNNNAYCQDNDISWFDWGAIDQDLLAFTQRASQIRAQHPVFRRRRWFEGRPLPDTGLVDIAWFRTDGEEMPPDDWQHDQAGSFVVFLNGDALHDTNDDGQPIRDDSVLLIFNAHHENVLFKMPAPTFGRVWHSTLDTLGRG